MRHLVEQRALFEEALGLVRGDPPERDDEPGLEQHLADLEEAEEVLRACIALDSASRWAQKAASLSEGIVSVKGRVLARVTEIRRAAAHRKSVDALLLRNLELVLCPAVSNRLFGGPQCGVCGDAIVTGESIIQEGYGYQYRHSCSVSWFPRGGLTAQYHARCVRVVETARSGCAGCGEPIAHASRVTYAVSGTAPAPGYLVAEGRGWSPLFLFHEECAGEGRSEPLITAVKLTYYQAAVS